MKTDWSTYNKVHASRKPREQLVRAVSFCNAKEEALDLGAGTLIESAYLLESGFAHVTAVDSNEQSQEFAKKFPKDGFQLITSSFQELDFEQEKYDVVNAQYALPFYGPTDFDGFIAKIIGSLKKGGIFVGQFFGVNDGWNTSESKLAFQTKDEVLNFLKHFELIECTEEEKDGTTAAGNTKHWHVFHFIAKKR